VGETVCSRLIGWWTLFKEAVKSRALFAGAVVVVAVIISQLLGIKGRQRENQPRLQVVMTKDTGKHVRPRRRPRRQRR
jgi:hypothetical protein